MGFEGRRKGKFKTAGEFVERMKKIQEKAKAALGKAQEEIKKYTDSVMSCLDYDQGRSIYRMMDKRIEPAASWLIVEYYQYK